MSKFVPSYLLNFTHVSNWMCLNVLTVNHINCRNRAVCWIVLRSLSISLKCFYHSGNLGRKYLHRCAHHLSGSSLGDNSTDMSHRCWHTPGYKGFGHTHLYLSTETKKYNHKIRHKRVNIYASCMLGVR